MDAKKLENLMFSLQLTRSSKGSRVDVDVEELHELLNAGLIEIQPNRDLDMRGTDILGNEARKKILGFLSDRPWEKAGVEELEPEKISHDAGQAVLMSKDKKRPVVDAPQA